MNGKAAGPYGTLIRVLLTLVIVLVLAEIVLFICFLRKDGGRQTEDISPEETPKPELQEESLLYRKVTGMLLDERGYETEIGELAEGPVVFLFWNSWCPDCHEYLAENAKALQSAVSGKGATLCWVCRGGRRGETMDTMRTAAAEYGLTGACYFDPESAFYQKLGLTGVPSLAAFTADMRYVGSSVYPGGTEEAQVLAETAKDGRCGAVLAGFSAALLSDEGGIPSSYELTDSFELKGKDEYLSETQGLVMNLALRRDDRTLFDRAYGFVRDVMTADGLSAWRRKDGSNGNVNATLDDLRILSALLEARSKWGGYEEDIRSREAALYGTVLSGSLRDCTDLETRSVSDTTSLCYIDLEALKSLEAFNSRWKGVSKTMKRILEGGKQKKGTVPFFAASYQWKTSSYTREMVNMIEMLIALQHAVRAGINAEDTLDWLEEQLSAGPVCARYTLKGLPAEGYQWESTAVYALLVQIGVETGREFLTASALERMEARRNKESGVWGIPGQHYTFDDLEAMLAWQCVTER